MSEEKNQEEFHFLLKLNTQTPRKGEKCFESKCDYDEVIAARIRSTDF